MRTEFFCSVCKQAKIYEKAETCSTGYAERYDLGVTRHGSGDKVCLDCCAREDIRSMREKGRITLYLSYNGKGSPSRRVDRWYSTGMGLSRDSADWSVSNWPGTLEFIPTLVKRGYHNMAGNRYDLWFLGPDGYMWHGVQYGDNTQICHCRRTKDLWASPKAMTVPAVRLDWPISADSHTRTIRLSPEEAMQEADRLHAFLSAGTSA